MTRNSCSAVGDARDMYVSVLTSSDFTAMGRFFKCLPILGKRYVRVGFGGVPTFGLTLGCICAILVGGRPWFASIFRSRKAIAQFTHIDTWAAPKICLSELITKSP